jgi:hypothetical protein
MGTQQSPSAFTFRQTPSPERHVGEKGQYHACDYTSLARARLCWRDCCLHSCHHQGARCLDLWSWIRSRYRPSPVSTILSKPLQFICLPALRVFSAVLWAAALEHLERLPAELHDPGRYLQTVSRILGPAQCWCTEAAPVGGLFHFRSIIKGERQGRCLATNRTARRNLARPRALTLL